MINKIRAKIVGLLALGKRVVMELLGVKNEINLGNQLLQQNRFEEAASIFKKHIKKFPNNPQGYEGMSVVALQTWQRETAEKWLNLSIEKTRAKSSYRRKSRLLIQHAQFEEGFAVIDEMLKIHGAEEDSILYQAESLFKPKRYAESIELLKSLDQSVATQMLLARALIGNKNYAAASAVIEKLPTPQQLSTKREQDILRLLTCWQKNHLAGAHFEQPKIFGIGLSRTATTSLTTALDLLGFTAIHFINPLTYQVIDIEDFKYYDAFCDSPVSFRFEELYDLFPHAKFIYTERNLADWVESNSNLYKPRGFSSTKEFKGWLENTNSGKFDKLYFNFDPLYQKAYGSLYADFPNWETAYQNFDQRVNQFFADKTADKLLKINICEHPEWDKLCTFLKVPIPNVPFPYSNTVVARKKAKS